MTTRTILVLAGIAGLGLAGAAPAATVTQCGPSICYQYDATQAAVAALGLPTLAGDSVFFTPSPAPFQAQSLNGAGIAVADATFVFEKVFSHDGSQVEGTGLEILSVTTEESGDYRLVGGDFVDVTLFLQAVNLVDAAQVDDTFSFFAAGDSGGFQDWSLAGALTPAASFAAAADRIRLTVQNTLLASTSATGQLAEIEKKFVVTVATVPVPGAVWLLASGLAAAGALRRRTAR